MGPLEILWRGKKIIQAKFEYLGLGLAHHPLPAQESWGRNWINVASSEFSTELYQQAAERVLAGKFDVFALHDAKLGFPPRWNCDPKTGITAPLCFGKTLDYRDEHQVGDIKYLWEPNRHYELVSLAQAFHLTGQTRYATACRQLLESWFLQAPYPLGINWINSLEHAIRILNWAVAWHLLGGAVAKFFEGQEGQDFKQRWLAAIYQHCHFIAGNLSRYSSANNHLFGEYMGLFIGAITWPCWQENTNWGCLAKQGMEDEALQQNAADGVNREQAIWYHHEVADMMLLCGLAGRAQGIEFSTAYWKRLESMLEFIHAMMDVAGNVPMIGDSDDAVMVRFSQEPGFDVFCSLLATGAVLFKRADFKHKAGHFDDKSRWLLGVQGSDIFASLKADYSSDKRISRIFPQSGYYILGKAFDTDAECKIVADAGPLGYLSIAAHGHADALAFTLSVGGKPLLIDPGTYAYHTQKKWRNYFRGTSAHNTVQIDGLDQSEPGGNFMWLCKAKARCENWESNDALDSFTASHDGYRRLTDPVMHRRKIVFHKQECKLVVEDTLECHSTHEVAFCWHFDPACTVMAENGKVTVICGNVRCEMQMPENKKRPDILLGRIESPFGWISHRFDEKMPSPSVVWSEKINGTVKRLTVFQITINPSVFKPVLTSVID